MHEDSKTAEFEGHNTICTDAVKKEHQYIYSKYNWYVKNKWRNIGLFMRLLDGSLLQSFFLNYFNKGKDIRKTFQLCYNSNIGVIQK